MPGIVQDPTFQTGRQKVTFTGTIARTDTAAKLLFTLPANAILLGFRYTSPAASDAGTTATISVGKSGGAGTEYLTTQDVKTVGTGRGQQYPVGPAASLLGQSVGGAAQGVTGIYAESGGASTTGGPWVIEFDVLLT